MNEENRLFPEPRDPISRWTYRRMENDKALVKKGPIAARRLLLETMAIWLVLFTLMLLSVHGSGWLRDGAIAVIFGASVAFSMTRLLRAQSYRSGYLDGHRSAIEIYDSEPDPQVARSRIMTHDLGHVLGLTNVSRTPDSPEGLQ